MQDQELVNRALRFYELKGETEETLAWMIKNFDVKRADMEWGSESPELLKAKELKAKIEKI